MLELGLTLTPAICMPVFPSDKRKQHRTNLYVRGRRPDIPALPAIADEEHIFTETKASPFIHPPNPPEIANAKMLARNLVITSLPYTLSATLPTHLRTPPTIVPPTNHTSSPLNLTTTPSHCFNPPHSHIHIYPAYLVDCENAASMILRNRNPFTAVTFSHQAPGFGFQLPANYRHRSCSISLNIGPGQTDFFQPRMAYLAAWELARECTSGMHQFGGRRTVGPKDKVEIYIKGVYVPGVGEEGGLVGMEVGNATVNVLADD